MELYYYLRLQINNKNEEIVGKLYIVDSPEKSVHDRDTKAFIIFKSSYSIMLNF